MFDNWEDLLCKCGKSFRGRRPVEDSYILCLECIAKFEIPIITEIDKIPKSVIDEITGGRGGNESN